MTRERNVCVGNGTYVPLKWVIAIAAALFAAGGAYVEHRWTLGRISEDVQTIKEHEWSAEADATYMDNFSKRNDLTMTRHPGRTQ
jgi:hypothetical protein